MRAGRCSRSQRTSALKTIPTLFATPARADDVGPSSLCWAIRPWTRRQVRFSAPSEGKLENRKPKVITSSCCRHHSRLVNGRNAQIAASRVRHAGPSATPCPSVKENAVKRTMTHYSSRGSPAAVHVRPRVNSRVSMSARPDMVTILNSICIAWVVGSIRYVIFPLVPISTAAPPVAGSTLMRTGPSGPSISVSPGFSGALSSMGAGVAGDAFSFGPHCPPPARTQDRRSYSGDPAGA
jgi:hypothetical protein